MPIGDDVPAWLRYFQRRAKEGFGDVGRSVADRKAVILGYIRVQCPQAADLLVAGWIS